MLGMPSLGLPSISHFSVYTFSRLGIFTVSLNLRSSPTWVRQSPGGPPGHACPCSRRRVRLCGSPKIPSLLALQVPVPARLLRLLPDFSFCLSPIAEDILRKRRPHVSPSRLSDLGRSPTGWGPEPARPWLALQPRLLPLSAAPSFQPLASLTGLQT